jgi:adenylosuccinate synthase
MCKVWAITDLQYGSSGKGFVTSLLSFHPKVKMVIRTGAPQAGHTAVVCGNRYVGRSIPIGRVNKNVLLLYGPGGVVSLETLKSELNDTPYSVVNRFFIHENAVIVTETDKEKEKESITTGSTFEGIGQARSRRAIRKATTIKLLLEIDGGNYNWLKQFVIDDNEYFNLIESVDGVILLEGHQGFGLSNWFGQYPYVTSVDTTVMANMSEAGLNPFMLQKVYGVMRTYEIRIAGNSGPLKRELKWDDIPTHPDPEFTTVTKKVRRIANVDWNLVKKAVMVNGVTDICITHADYFENNQEIHNFAMSVLAHTRRYDPKISLINRNSDISKIVETSDLGCMSQEFLDAFNQFNISRNIFEGV